MSNLPDKARLKMIRDAYDKLPSTISIPTVCIVPMGYQFWTDVEKYLNTLSEIEKVIYDINYKPTKENV